MQQRPSLKTPTQHHVHAICPEHNEPIRGVCLDIYCQNRLLCSYCRKCHDQNHFKAYEDIDDVANASTRQLKEMKEILKEQEAELAIDTADIQLVQSKIEKVKEELIQSFTQMLEEMKQRLFRALNKRAFNTPEKFEKNKQSIERIAFLAQEFRKNPLDTQCLDEIALSQYEFYSSNKTSVSSSGEGTGSTIPLRNELTINSRVVQSWKQNLQINLGELESNIFKTQAKSLKNSTIKPKTTEEQDDQSEKEKRFRAYEFDNIKGHEIIETGHQDINPGAITYLQDKQLIISGGVEGVIKLWHPQTRQCVHKINHEAPITKIFYIENTEFIFVGDRQSLITIYNLKHYKAVSQYKGHQGSIQAIELLKDCNYIASGGIDKNVKVWDYHKNSTITELYTDGYGVGALAYMKAFKRLSIGLQNGNILIFAIIDDGKKGVLLYTLKGHSPDLYINHLRIQNSKHGIEILFSSSSDGTINVWKLMEKSGTLEGTLERIDRNSKIYSFVYLDRMNVLVNSNNNRYLSIWDVGKRETIQELQGDSKTAKGKAMLYLEDKGQILSVFGSDLKFWKIKFPPENKRGSVLQSRTTLASYRSQLK